MQEKMTLNLMLTSRSLGWFSNKERSYSSVLKFGYDMPAVVGMDSRKRKFDVPVEIINFRVVKSNVFKTVANWKYFARYIIYNAVGNVPICDIVTSVKEAIIVFLDTA